MKVFKIVLGILAIFPIAMIVSSIIHPEYTQSENSSFELSFVFFGTPILVLNVLAWFKPESIEKLFGIKANNQ